MELECPVCSAIIQCTQDKFLVVADCENCQHTLVAIGYQTSLTVRKLDELPNWARKRVLQCHATGEFDSLDVVELVMAIDDSDQDDEGGPAVGVA